MNALILVDMQNDFMPGGALAVPDGSAVIPVANDLQQHFKLIVATQDWHPRAHVSFAVNHEGKQAGDLIDVDSQPQILWPVHCVQFTNGADFHPDLNRSRLAQIFYKGVDPGVDSYSAFFDNHHSKATGLGKYLRELAVTTVYIAGLATDYCIKYTVLDAIDLGFKTYVVTDGCRGVNLKPGDSKKALKEMEAKGATLVKSEDIVG